MIYFPFTYTGEIVFYKPEVFNQEQFVRALNTKLHLTELSPTELAGTCNFSFTKLPVNIKVKLVNDNTTITCQYKISMFENNLVFLVSVLTAFYLSHNNSPVGVVFSVVAGVAFYLFNTLKISNTIKQIIYSQPNVEQQIGEPELWRMQKKWMENVNLCPACGEPKNPYSNKCVNCGVYYSNRHLQQSHNTNATGQNDIVYEVAPKKR